jgi:hypothetical protein
VDNYYFDVTIEGRPHDSAASRALEAMFGGPVVDVHAFSPPGHGETGDWSIQGGIMASSIDAAAPMLAQVFNLWSGDLDGPPITRLTLRTGEQFDIDFLEASAD